MVRSDATTCTGTYTPVSDLLELAPTNAGTGASDVQEPVPGVLEWAPSNAGTNADQCCNGLLANGDGAGRQTSCSAGCWNQWRVLLRPEIVEATTTVSVDYDLDARLCRMLQPATPKYPTARRRRCNRRSRSCDQCEGCKLLTEVGDRSCKPPKTVL